MKPLSGPVAGAVPPRGSGAAAVILVGFMGAGKTSVGRLLGQRLGWTFADLDDRIQAREGCSISEIFRDSGEVGFRQAEHAALRDLLAEPGSSRRIIALGGGAFAQPENAALLEESGAFVVFLDGPAEELFQRCQQQPLERPLRRDKEQFRELYDKRRPAYLKARWRVDTSGKDPETIAVEVACILGLQ